MVPRRTAISLPCLALRCVELHSVRRFAFLWGTNMLSTLFSVSVYIFGGQGGSLKTSCARSNRTAHPLGSGRSPDVLPQTSGSMHPKTYERSLFHKSLAHETFTYGRTLTTKVGQLCSPQSPPLLDSHTVPSLPLAPHNNIAPETRSMHPPISSTHVGYVFCLFWFVLGSPR